MYGIYPRRSAYDWIVSIESFQPWLDRVASFPEQVIDEALGTIPRQWLPDGGDELEKMVEQLMSRRRRIEESVIDARMAKTNPFANWR